ncbi:TlpA family protein disulfide reductase [bacterium]|nr:TlpA family protein disulfide reductase [bacterium]
MPYTNFSHATNRGNNIRSIFILVFLIVPLLVFSIRDGQAEELKIGDKAPNLMGFDPVSGSRLNLYRVLTQMRFKTDDQGTLLVGGDGKYINEFIHFPVVLNFFAKTCIPCLREIPTFNKIAARFQGKPVSFLYVNVDPDLSSEDAKAMLQRFNIEIPMMMPNQNEAIRKYDAAKLPRLVVIDQKKQISKLITGFNENLEDDLTTHLSKMLVE